MNIQHFEKGLTYSDEQVKLIARKVGKLATYCEKVRDEGSSIRIDSEARKTIKGRDRMKVSITIELPGKVLRSSSRKPDPMEAVDRAIEKVAPQIKKYKAKRIKKGR